MEKIKVNMSPNPLDVQTIHASQNDGEARQWEFELHNNGELIDTSNVTEQMFFKSYKGGTEQILPENTSTPTTSPFKGDIRYPQGLLTDQEFTYRQSPTEEDGLAKITEIKGNTLVWNQLVQNGNFANNSIWSLPSTATAVISNNELSSTYTSAYPSVSQALSIKAGHKFYLSFDYKASVNNNTPNGFFFSDTQDRSVLVTALNYTTTYQKYEGILSYSNNDLARIRLAYFEPNRWTAGDVISIKNVQLFDLTQMGLDITDPSDFTSLFPLSYYSYNQGSLLSFNGNGIKTVGKNLFDFSQFANGTITFENGVLTGTAAQFNSAYGNVVNNGIELKYSKNTQITISFDARTEQNASASGIGLYLYSSENGIATMLARTMNDTDAIQHITVTIPSDRHIDKLGWSYGSDGTNIWHITNFQVEFGTETEYEPYTSSTLSLPISTYFPNGMDGVGTDYDELTNTKATARMARVDLGSINWGYIPSAQRFYAINFANVKTNAENVLANICCALYENSIWSQVQGDVTKDKVISVANKNILIRDKTYTDPTVFKNSLNGIYLVYPLATPTETSFTTASLVTENAEIPLSNEDGTLIGKCTEELSAEPGFHDAKIKLSDSDGDVYSNKIQLHVERSPQ